MIAMTIFMRLSSPFACRSGTMPPADMTARRPYGRAASHNKESHSVPVWQAIEFKRLFL
jgi:hypothetical protein